MTVSFADRRTEALYRAESCHPAWRSIETVALRKLDMAAAAVKVFDLRAPPANRLEKLRGDRDGQWSIRISDQWRICFHWTEFGPERVEIVDYH